MGHANAASSAVFDPEGADRFRQVFETAGYSAEGLNDTLGDGALPLYRGQSSAHFLHLTRRGRPLDTLIRLFMLGLSEPVETARRALAPLPLADWQKAGLITLSGDLVVSEVRVEIYHGLLIAADHRPPATEPVPANHVLGITNSCTMLSDFTVRRPVATALDVGTGSGVLALVASRHSRQVYGTDTNSRAIALARFNAAMNSIAAVEFREGSCYDPVPGQKFDLIVCNPPFVVTPSSSYIYRDSGVEGDGFARKLIADGATRLQPGGFMQIVCDWIHPLGGGWKERLAEWFQGTGCDAWAVGTNTLDASTYAHLWIKDSEPADDVRNARTHRDWLAFYQRERIEAITTGLIALRNSGSSRPFVRIDENPVRLDGLGDFIWRGFRLRDYLDQVSRDEDLLQATLRVSPDAALSHSCGWQDSSWRVRASAIRLNRGLQLEGSIDLRLANMVALCDGRRTVRQVVEETARSLEVPFERALPNCLGLIRKFVENAFLLPPGEWS
jgi:hypothetical protein